MAMKSHTNSYVPQYFNAITRGDLLSNIGMNVISANTRVFVLSVREEIMTSLGRPEQPFRMGLCFTADVFVCFATRSPSSLDRALKLCHMVGIWLYFIIALQKFGGRSPKKIWGTKTCKIS